MRCKAYYNEHDAYAAQWLRNLIATGHIAPGDVDERSIEDVRPDDLVGYRQCHFFAGVGVWSYALRQAGISDDTPVWTGSCPCQPFSAAGEGNGFADERHLWPAFFHLIEQCGPAMVFGEQVSGADADPWIDLVCADLESLGYAFGALAFPAASVGAPHIRDRLYWLADTSSERWNGRQDPSGPRGRACVEADGATGRLAIANDSRRETAAVSVRPTRQEQAQAVERRAGYWSTADWIPCADGKARPIEPGLEPVVAGAPSRVGRLRAYGNAINAEAAIAFIEAAA